MRAFKKSPAVWLLAVAIALLFVANIVQVAINRTNERQDTAISGSDRTIRESQYRACIINGNTLRNQVRREFVDLKRKVLIPEAIDLRQLFGFVAEMTTPGPVADAIAGAADAEQGRIDYMHKRIKSIRDRLPDVDCMAVYPPLPGQVYPSVKELRQGASGLRPEVKGGGTSSTGSSPSSPPSPPPSGGGSGNNGGSGSNNPPNPPVGNPPTNPPPGNPPPNPGLVDPVTHQVPGLECHVNVTGIQVCN